MVGSFFGWVPSLASATVIQSSTLRAGDPAPPASGFSGPSPLNLYGPGQGHRNWTAVRERVPPHRTFRLSSLGREAARTRLAGFTRAGRNRRSPGSCYLLSCADARCSRMGAYAFSESIDSAPSDLQ